MTVKYVSIKRVPIAELTPFPGNARRGNIEELRASIRRHGQYKALLVRRLDDGELVIVAGNNTCEALAAEGYTVARCEIMTCDDDEALRINLADNRLADLGEYDGVSLVAQLQALGGDMDGIGYTPDDLSTWLRTTGTFADEATGFLKGLVNPDNPAGDFQPNKEGIPPPDPGYVAMSWTCTTEQRDIVRAAVRAAQEEWKLSTSTEALAAIAQHYLTEREHT